MATEVGQILCWAAVAYEPKQAMRIEQVYVGAPKAGEVRIKVIANALCHTDVYRLDGFDPEGNFPCILGHQATGVVESIGEGVHRIKVGDIVIPCYTPQCKEKSCVFCQHPSSNICPKIRSTQGPGLMPDGTTRFRSKDGKQIFHFMGCSTFSEYTVIAQISAAKINPHADLNKVCLIGCGISTGWGAVMNNCNVEAGTTVAVWGLGAVGLAVVQAAKIRGARAIYAIDVNSQKFVIAKKFGATHCFQPTKDKTAKQFLLDQEKWGIHYTFDATGNVAVMREALQTAHRGFGQSCVIGVAEGGKEIATRSFQLVTGRKWIGTAFGGWKSLQDVPKLVNKATLGEWPIEDFITHQFNGISKVNEAVQALHGGNCLRAVVKISAPPETQKISIKILNSVKLLEGLLQTVEHWSEATSSFMKFNIYIPECELDKERGEPFPVLYFLSGLGSTHENAAQKSGFAHCAHKHKIAVVFPDTSPRQTGIKDVEGDSDWGDSAGYYVDSTQEPYKKHFRMHTYITQQLPSVVAQFFPVSIKKISITGYSMGGHGALIAALTNPQYRSVSAFAPMANPTLCPDWGIKAYSHFFKAPQQEGKQYDATEIIRSKKYRSLPLFIDVGSADQFASKLLLNNLIEELDNVNYQYKYKIRAGYNHSFFYVSSFIKEHFQFHSRYLNAP